MYYSLIGVLAILILFITNHDVIFVKRTAVANSVQKVYRRWLFAVCIYYITDIVWGILEALHQTFLLYIDTEIYFVTLALGVSLWTNYVIEYLSEKKRFHKFLFYAGRFFFGTVFLLVLINLFYPVIFWFDQEGLYHTGPIRYAILIAQIILLLLTSTYSHIVKAHSVGAMKKRYFIIGSIIDSYWLYFVKRSAVKSGNPPI